ncbi:hypothetical protein ACIQUM_20735 [Amycolatopsis azurea]|uniref:hypothetical protein n=1 Tax=Amycolatopsis azurea TaxID=36819 RepID=UPI00380034A7
MQPDDRVALLDLENLGIARMRPRPMRAHLETVLLVIGPAHHVVAAYAAEPVRPDERASLLAELGVAPLIVEQGRDAAELALLEHARHVHEVGGRTFLVGSADGAFAELAQLGVVDVLARKHQPIAAKLAAAAREEYRLPRTGEPEPVPAPHSRLAAPAVAGPGDGGAGRRLGSRAAVAILTGVGLAVGQRLVDALLRGRH